MSMSMNAPLPAPGGQLAPKTDADYPTRLVDIKPGSQIRIGGPKVGGPPFTAIVLQVHPEFGATGEPALFVVRDDVPGDIELLISQAAGYDVTVTASAEGFITDEVPEGAVRVQVRPVFGTAMQFKGGVENATAIIRWALGRGAPRYVKGDDLTEEHLLFGGIGVDHGVVRIGDWIVLHDDNTFHVTSDLPATYDEVI